MLDWDGVTEELNVKYIRPKKENCILYYEKKN